MNLVSHLSLQAESRPDAPALIDHSTGAPRTLTFAQLESATAAGAHLFQSSGLALGDRILFAQPVSLELYIGLLSAFRCGAVAVFADVSAGRDHLDSVCRALRPDAFFGSPVAHLLRLTSPAIRKIPIRFSTSRPIWGATQFKTDAPLTFPPTKLTPDHPALLSFTSGSTGQPKIIARSHPFLLAQNKSLSKTLALRPGEVDLVTLPVFALANLASGVTSALADTDLRRPGFPDAKSIATQLASDRPTRATASPSFFGSLLASDIDLSSLTQIYTGGAPVFPRLLGALQQAAPHAKVIAVYGSSEAEPIAHLDAATITEADHHSMRTGAGLLAGIPVPDIELRILPSPWNPREAPLTGEEFTSLTLPDGRTGEIIVTGAHVLTGYLDGVGDRQTKIHVGQKIWHRTGDSGRIDSQGRLWLCGRASSTLRDSTGILHPLAAECALSYLPEIKRSAILSHRGQRVAVVESKPYACPNRITATIPWANITSVLNRPIPQDPRHNAKTDYPTLRASLR